MTITWKDYLEKSKPADTDELMALDTTASANKRVKFSGIWDWIVDKMATAVMSKLETQNKTLIGAVNELNSKTIISTNNDTIFKFNISLSNNSYTTLFMYGSTSKTEAFAYLVFIDTAAYSREMTFHKIIDESIIIFSGTYNDITKVLTVTANKTIYGGLRILAIK